MDFECLTVHVDHFLVGAPDIEGLPPSARRVYRAVIDQGPATLPQLEKETGLARRTVAYAISRLKDERLIAWHARLDDFRYRYFFVHPRLVDDERADAEGTVIRLQANERPPSAQLAHLFG